MSDYTELDNLNSISTDEVSIINLCRTSIQNFLNTDPLDSNEIVMRRNEIFDSFEKLKVTFLSVFKIAEQYYNPNQRFSSAIPSNSYRGLGTVLLDAFTHYLHLHNARTLIDYVDNCKMILTYLREVLYVTE